jgi:hypothetical protein
MTPKIGSRWVRSNNIFSPGVGDYNAYTVFIITNTENSHVNHPPQVIYQGDNGNWWSLPLEQWPGNLKKEVI